MLNYKKFSFWLIVVAIAAVIITGVALLASQKQGGPDRAEGGYAENLAGTIYETEYDKVKIEFLSGMTGTKSANEFETTYSGIIAFIDSTIDSTLQTGMIPGKEDNLENNNTNRYTIELSGDAGGYCCEMYHDALYNKAYIIKDGVLYGISTDFARYIDSLLENTSVDFSIDHADAVELFQNYGWTLNYQINGMNMKLGNIKELSGFNPNAYYFAYNNELSKDIGLDMSEHSNTGVDIEIYRIYESMPKEFYPVQDCRGIVVRRNGKIIGAFISAGRHSTFNACSLKGNGFKEVTGMTVDEWLANTVKANKIDAGLSKLKSEQIIEKYFKALQSKDAETAEHCISKKTLLDSISGNISNDELFNEKAGLPLTGNDIGARSAFENLGSAELLKAELTGERDNHTKVYRVTVDLKYRRDITISSGQQTWDCNVVYESSQTGWKIEGFGH